MGYVEVWVYHEGKSGPILGGLEAKGLKEEGDPAEDEGDKLEKVGVPVTAREVC